MATYRELAPDLPSEYETLKQNVHRFATEVMRPAAAALDRMSDPRDVAALDSPLRQVLRAAWGLGYHAAGIPVEYGGLGLRGLARHILLEELGWGSAGLAISIAVAGFPFSAVAACGDGPLIERFVKPFVADREAKFIGCWAISEPAHAATTAMAAVFTGVARAAYEEAMGYTQQRVQGGKTLADHQLVRKRLFDMFTKVEAARALSRATMVYNHASQAPSLENAIAAKIFCTEAAFQVTSDAVQLFGANGLSKDYPVEKLFRDARVSMIEVGSNDVLALTGANHLILRSGPS